MFLRQLLVTQFHETSQYSEWARNKVWGTLGESCENGVARCPLTCSHFTPCQKSQGGMSFLPLSGTVLGEAEGNPILDFCCYSSYTLGIISCIPQLPQNVISEWFYKLVFFEDKTMENCYSAIMMMPLSSVCFMPCILYRLNISALQES